MMFIAYSLGQSYSGPDCSRLAQRRAHVARQRRHHFVHFVALSRAGAVVWRLADHPLVCRRSRQKQPRRLDCRALSNGAQHGARCGHRFAWPRWLACARFARNRAAARSWAQVEARSAVRAASRSDCESKVRMARVSFVFLWKKMIFLGFYLESIFFLNNFEYYYFVFLFV